MSSPAPPLPPLDTLAMKPTWVNRTGRVDRSACMEISASECRHHARMKSARTSKGREAAGECTITAQFLYRRHNTRKPFHLSGDFRTDKSNAMKDPKIEQLRRSMDRRMKAHFKDKHIGRARFAASPQHGGDVRIAYANPNKGATRSKMLGLSGKGDFAGEWTQTARIERWRLSSRVAQHFLLCPICKRKVRKLFMALCSEDEVRDAELAEGWVRMVDARFAAARRPMPTEVMSMRVRLIERYGLLFHGRRLLCRTCMGVRYGQVRKEKVAKRIMPEKASIAPDAPQSGASAVGRVRKKSPPRLKKAEREAMAQITGVMNSLKRCDDLVAQVNELEKRLGR